MIYSLITNPIFGIFTIGERLGTLNLQQGDIWKFDFNGSINKFMTRAEDNTFQIWNSETGKKFIY